MEKELTDFLEWYWDEIDGKPYQTTALEIVEDYMEAYNARWVK